MKTPIVLFLIIGTLLSCTDHDLRVVDMRINHYQVTGTGMYPVLELQVQEGKDIGTINWTNFYNQIDGFTYVPGYIYDLTVEVKSVDHPPADGSSLRYTLRKVRSTQEVAIDTQFDIKLKFNGENYVTTVSGYKLLNQVEFDCNDLCDELDGALQNQDVVVGTFKRNQNKLLQLVTLK